MKSVNIHGVQLETGFLPGDADKPPLVFLHEGLGSVAMWHQKGRHWPSELCQATGRAGWIYSRRGYGQSDPVEDVRGASRWAGQWHIGRHEPDYMHHEAWQVLPAWLAAIGVKEPILIGHSDGATIALLHASKHLVTACVAMAPHVRVEDVALTSIAQAKSSYQAPDGAFKKRLSRHHADVDNAFWQWNDVWLSEAFKSFDIRPECGRIRSPLLCVQGLDDEYGTLQQLKDIAMVQAGSKQVELPNCGHSPHRDQPDRLTDAVVRFLNANAP
jgi:pimeloyl-ACP methyl ester carboxylesterase